MGQHTYFTTSENIPLLKLKYHLFRTLKIFGSLKHSIDCILYIAYVSYCTHKIPHNEIRSGQVRTLLIFHAYRQLWFDYDII